MIIQQFNACAATRLLARYSIPFTWSAPLNCDRLCSPFISPFITILLKKIKPFEIHAPIKMELNAISYFVVLCACVCVEGFEQTTYSLYCLSNWVVNARIIPYENCMPF